MTNNEVPTWFNYVVRIAINTATHPLEYAKVLIQIGHEPIPPYKCRTVFGKPALCLPNVFEYVSYIKRVDGFSGCYQGFTPKLCTNIVSGLTFHKVSKAVSHVELNADNAVDDASSGQDLSREEKRNRFLRELQRDIIARSSAIIVSHPFQVISVTMMAQFVGGENKFTSMFHCVVELYKEFGLAAFFRGLIPRLVGELFSLLIGNTLAFLVNTYIIHDDDVKQYSTASMHFFASTLTYPYHVVANCMIVSNSGLLAGRPPYMQYYTSWRDCWAHLSKINQLKRGSSLVWRYYTSPEILYKNTVIPTSDYLTLM